MVYSYFADYAKKFAHLSIESTFPRTGSIAVASAATGWYAYRFVSTHGPNKIVQMTEQFFGGFLSKESATSIGLASWTAIFVSPFYAPEATQAVAEKTGLAVSLATSFVLNMMAQAIFGIKSVKDDKHILNEALKNAGLDPKPEEPAVPQLSETLLDSTLPLFKDDSLHSILLKPSPHDVLSAGPILNPYIPKREISTENLFGDPVIKRRCSFIKC